jgi:hypothetical protein
VYSLSLCAYHVLEEEELVLVHALGPEVVYLVPGEQAGTRVRLVDGLGQQGAQLLGV